MSTESSKITPILSILSKIPIYPGTPPPAVCYTVGNPAYYAHPGPRNPQAQRTPGGGTTAAYIVPPPRRRASPAQKQNRRGLLSPLHCVTLRSQTRPSTAQRGRGSPLPVVGGRKVKKTQTSMFAFFPHSRLPASPPLYRRKRAYSARPDFRLPITSSVISPTAS
jgi:hypothetical protein